jgi:hypothetical protein
MPSPNERDRLINAAIAAGKFPESRRAHYARLYDAQPQATARFIDTLAAGVVPDVTVPEPAYPAAAGAPSPGPSEYPDTGLSASERQRVAAIREGKQHARIVNEA